MIFSTNTTLEDARLRVICTPVGPPVEVTRWLLEMRHFPYAEEAHAPGIHVFLSRKFKVPDELPLLITPDGASGGLLDCMEALDEKMIGYEKVFGNSVEARSRISQWVKYFHNELFMHAVRIYYFNVLEHRNLALKYALQKVPFWEKVLINLVFPVWKKAMKQGLKLIDFDQEQAVERCNEVFKKVEDEITKRGPFLDGDQPGTSDIVFAALSAPLILPEKYGASLPSPETLPALYKSIVNRFRSGPAGKLVFEIYDKLRPMPQTRAHFSRKHKFLQDTFAGPKTQLAAGRLLLRHLPILTIANTIVLSKWKDVTEALDRDADFQIGPINEARITAVTGPFILGMDRSPSLFIQRDAVYASLHAADKAPYMDILQTEPRKLLLSAQKRHGRIDVVNGYARLVAARAAVALFGLRRVPEQDLIRVARACFHEIFLNLGNDRKVKSLGSESGKELLRWIEEEIQFRKGAAHNPHDVLQALMNWEGRDGITSAEIGSMLAGLLVGAIDTTATAVANIVAEMLTTHSLKTSMKDDLGNPSRFLGWCWEALRQRPHNPVLLRQCARDTTIGNTKVKQNNRVFLITIGAMQDPYAFIDPKILDPGRPLDRYLHFGRGLHWCSGRNFNAMQIPKLVAELLQVGILPKGKLIFRGPFPDELVVLLKQDAV